jgi:hypothetical protein
MRHGTKPDVKLGEYYVPKLIREFVWLRCKDEDGEMCVVTVFNIENSNKQDRTTCVFFDDDDSTEEVFIFENFEDLGINIGKIKDEV